MLLNQPYKYVQCTNCNHAGNDTYHQTAHHWPYMYVVQYSRLIAYTTLTTIMLTFVSAMFTSRSVWLCAIYNVINCLLLVISSFMQCFMDCFFWETKFLQITDCLQIIQRLPFKHFTTGWWGAHCYGNCTLSTSPLLFVRATSTLCCG